MAEHPSPLEGEGRVGGVRRVIAVVLTALLAGCSFVPDYERPSAPVPRATISLR